MKISEYIQFDGLGLAELIQKGDVSASELVEIAIQLIEEKNPALNAVICKMYDEARKRASETLIQVPFSGVPFLLKDIWGDYPGYPATMGSRFLKDYYPIKMAPIVERFMNSGLIFLGKTNCPEFGTIASTESILFGAAHNPWDLSRTPGGSSGGAAAAVAARMVPIAHGNDAGGSLRIPAACCGVFSLKTSRGRTPNYIPGKMVLGMVSENVISKSVRDSAAMLDATCAPQLGAAFTLPIPNETFLQQIQKAPKPLKIAFSATPFFEHITIDPEIKIALENAAKLCESLGHHVTEASPTLNQAELLMANIIVFTNESAAYSQLYQKIFPNRKLENYVERHNIGVGKAAKLFTAEEFAWADMIFDKVHFQMEQFFQNYDVLLTPTQPHLPLKLGHSIPSATESIIGNFLADILPKKWVIALLKKNASKSLRAVAYTMFFNITGQPAMSVPLFWNENRLPIGMQFAAKYGDDGLLLQLAHQLEIASPWADKIPTNTHKSPQSF